MAVARECCGFYIWRANAAAATGINNGGVDGTGIARTGAEPRRERGMADLRKAAIPDDFMHAPIAGEILLEDASSTGVELGERQDDMARTLFTYCIVFEWTYNRGTGRDGAKYSPEEGTGAEPKGRLLRVSVRSGNFVSLSGVALITIVLPNYVLHATCLCPCVYVCGGRWGGGG